MPVIRKLQMVGSGHRETATPIPDQVKRTREKPIPGRPTVYYHEDFVDGDVLDFDISDPATAIQVNRLIKLNRAVDVTPAPAPTSPIAAAKTE